MKVNALNDKIIVYTYDTKFNDINDYIKKIILKLRKNYRLNVFGFYQVDVYYNKKVGMIIEVIKDEDIDSFYDLLDLKINVYEDSDIFLKFDDYFLDYKKNMFVFNDKYYLNVEDLSKKELFEMVEFCSFVYGSELERIRKKFVCLI